MKVLAFTPLYRPHAGGIEILVEDLARRLRAYRIETAIVTNDSGSLPPCEFREEAVVHRVRMARGLAASRLPINPDPSAPLKFLRQIVDIVEEEKPDLIHLHASPSPDIWYVDRLLRKASSIPFVITMHAVLEPPDHIGVLRHLLLTADALTAVSHAVMRSALDFSNRQKLSIVIPNGVRKKAWKGRRMETWPKITCVGRLEHNKGFDVAIEALAQIRRSGLDAELTLIGHGEERANLERVADRLGVFDRVHFKGVLDHESTLAEIAASSLVLVPARAHEGFSLVAAEAAMAGVPCIASRVGGLPETVEDGVCGFIVRPDDAGGLASAAVRLLGDETRRLVMGKNARRRANIRFDLDRCVERYAELYGRLHGGFSGRKAA